MPHPSSSTPVNTIYVTASRYKDHALQLAHRVAKTGEEVVVTVRGQPLAKLSAVMRRSGNRFVGAGRQAVRVQGGIAALDALTSPRRLTGGAEGKDAAAAALPEGPRRLAIGAPRPAHGRDAGRALLTSGDALDGLDGGEHVMLDGDESEDAGLGDDLLIDIDSDATA